MFQHIIGQDTYYNVKDLGIYKDNVKFLDRIKDLVDEWCPKSSKCHDDDPEKLRKVIQSYSQGMNVDDLEFVNDDHDKKEL